LLLGPLSDADADGLYDHCRRLGTTLQVPDRAWPADRTAFEAYWRETSAGVHYDDPVRDHLLAVTELRMLPRWMRLGNARLNRFATVGSLPPAFRSAMRLDWSERDQQRFDRLFAVLRVVTRLMPRWARMLPIRLQLLEVRLRIRRGWRLT
jgi:uncharacterized protein (DUF2236 family)